MVAVLKSRLDRLKNYDLSPQAYCLEYYKILLDSKLRRKKYYGHIDWEFPDNVEFHFVKKPRSRYLTSVRGYTVSLRHGSKFPGIQQWISENLKGKFLDRMCKHTNQIL